MSPKPSHAIPPPRATDSEDVRWGLSTAAALWTSGERHDALKWLRRAADAASHLDDDRRTMELLHVLSEVASTLKAFGEAVAPTTPASTVRRAVPPPLPKQRLRATEPPRALPPPARSAPRPLPPMLPPPPVPRTNLELRVAVHIRHGVARLEPLADGAPAPAGAALALLVPVGKSDASALSAWLLASERARRAVRLVPQDRESMQARATSA
jgi:hypothetical protein